jgi:uncharacterized OsmC-like protein
VDCGFSVSQAVRGEPPNPNPRRDPDHATDRHDDLVSSIKETPMSTDTLPNGVNAGAVVAYAQQLQAAAPPDGTQFRADVRWRGGFRNEIRVRDLPATFADEPEILGGTNTAANPVEQILGALGSCLAIGYTAGAVARGITIDDLRIELVGNIDLPVFFGLKEGHAGYERVDASVFLKTDAPPEAIEALHADVFRTSPVGNTIERPATLNVQVISDPLAERLVS